MANSPQKTIIDRTLDVLMSVAEGSPCSPDVAEQAHSDLQALSDDIASIDLQLEMLQIAPTGNEYNEVIDLLEIGYHDFPHASARLLWHELSYAYPSSEQAQKLGCSKNGCYVLNAKGETRAFESLAMALQCTVALSTQPRRWSIDHPANRQFTDFNFNHALLAGTC